MPVAPAAAALALLIAVVTQTVPAQRLLSPHVTPLTPANARRPAEVSVAINPTNPEHVIAVMMQAGAPGEPRVVNYSYSSQDGGLTWTPVRSANASDRVQGDDAVVFGRDGTAYHSYISFDG